MRRRYIQHPETFELIPAELYERPRSSGVYVIPDINPYQAVAADKETGKCPTIMGRRQHREFLKRNGYEELGNDPVRPRSDDGSIDRTTASVMDEIRQKWRG